ncbi:DUF4232 domain-containing protein [Prauserella oleivorans]|uniref:DUF4232 domain-containing protein n=1 Tax=Prauserella oleivorans TaxID=1478153 RepID=A0ABW5W959_9PSEU
MKRRWGYGLLTLLIAGACTSAPEPIDPVRTPVPTPPAEACPETGVRVTVGIDEAAMGLRVLGLTLTNCGDRPYQLEGYPQLRLLDEAGKPMDVRVEHGSAGIATVDGFDAPPRALTLRAGEVARTNLMWRNTNTSAGTPAVGDTLSVAPVEGRPWQPVELTGGYEDGLHIDVGSTGLIGVRAWYR